MSAVWECYTMQRKDLEQSSFKTCPEKFEEEHIGEKSSTVLSEM